MATLQTGASTRSSGLVRPLLTGLVIVVTLFLLLSHLSDYPRPWYDEGSHLHVAKNYALNGVYADSSSEGYRAFGPAIGVGPTIMLPVALLFKLFGVSIPLARLVIVAYSLLTLLVLYFIVQRFASWQHALLAVVLLVGVPSIGYTFYSRTVVGEVPGIFFLLLGIGLWLHPRGRSIAGLVGVGVLIGLSTITKNQFAFFILPAILLNWIADLIWYKQRGWRYFVIPGLISGLMFGLWLFIVVVKLGQGDNFSENLATLRTAGTGAFIVIDKDSIPRAIALLTGVGVYGAMFIPAFIYGVVTSLQRNEQGQNRGIIAIFLIVSTALFCASLAWDRYAFGPVVLVVIFVVLLIRDLIAIVNLKATSWWATLRDGKSTPAVVIGALLLGWFVIAALIPLYNRYHEMSTQANGDSYLVADWVKANVPKDAVIETWEQEMGVLTDNKIHYPPQLILAYAVAQQWQHGPSPLDFYDFRTESNPDYLIRGPFGVFTGLYPEDHLNEYEVIKVIGAYQIYQKRS